MIQPVYNAISQLLQWKGSASISEIAKISGCKAVNVLRVLNDNSSRLLKNKKGIVTNFNRLPIYRNPDERWYKAEAINYGAANALVCTYFYDVKDLVKPYICGGIGDSFTIEVILDTSANRAELAKRGYVEQSQRATKTVEECWLEDEMLATCVCL